MSAGYFPKREKIGLEDLFKGLVTASHILHNNNVLDAYGHISVRSPDNPATFWMPCNISPALVNSPDDLIEYNVEDATPVEENAKPGYLERHIHSEMYKRFPGINSVVHSHCGDVLPYCISGVPLKATIHMAGFLGVYFHPLNSPLIRLLTMLVQEATHPYGTLLPTTPAVLSTIFSSATPLSVHRSPQPSNPQPQLASYTRRCALPSQHNSAANRLTQRRIQTTLSF